VSKKYAKRIPENFGSRMIGESRLEMTARGTVLHFRFARLPRDKTVECSYNTTKKELDSSRENISCRALSCGCMAFSTMKGMHRDVMRWLLLPRWSKQAAHNTQRHHIFQYTQQRDKHTHITIAPRNPHSIHNFHHNTYKSTK
jgi:hypothetical protein